MAKSTQLIDNEVFQAYATYTAIVLLKMMLMSLVTAYYRITRKAFVNPEDTASFGKGDSAKKYLRTDPDVERVRRGHLNDLENIVPFVGIGLLYALSGPELSTALLHFRIFAGARIFHTFAYLIPLPQPGRGLSWAVGYAVTFSMAYKSAEDSVGPVTESWLLCTIRHSTQSFQQCMVPAVSEPI